jgi:hypothetical protein
MKSSIILLVKLLLLVLLIISIAITTTFGQSTNDIPDLSVNSTYRFQAFHLEVCAGDDWKNLECAENNKEVFVTLDELESTLKIYSKQYQQFDIISSTQPSLDEEGNYITTMEAVNIDGKRCDILLKKLKRYDGYNFIVLRIVYRDYITPLGNEVRLYTLTYGMTAKQ